MRVTDVFRRDLFAGQHVFITGGGSGINLGIAKNFAALGANVGICGRSQERLDGAATEIRALGGAVFARSADVRDYAAVEAAMNGACDAFGPMSTLVCGAAGNFPAVADKISPNGFKAVIDIDVLGSFHAARAAFEQLCQTRGSIVFISAGQAFQAYPMQAHVGAAKAGVDMLMKNLAVDWGRYGIRSKRGRRVPRIAARQLRYRDRPRRRRRAKFSGLGGVGAGVLRTRLLTCRSIAIVPKTEERRLANGRER